MTTPTVPVEDHSGPPAPEAGRQISAPAGLLDVLCGAGASPAGKGRSLPVKTRPKHSFGGFLKENIQYPICRIMSRVRMRPRSEHKKRATAGLSVSNAPRATWCRSTNDLQRAPVNLGAPFNSPYSQSSSTASFKSPHSMSCFMKDCMKVMTFSGLQGEMETFPSLNVVS